MTPKYRWNRIVASSCFGLFYGFIIALGAVCLVVVAQSLLKWLGVLLPEPSDFLSYLLFAAFCCPPLALCVAFAIGEARENIKEYRAAVNRCKACGYSLRGVRRISDRCPECGKLFRKWD